MCTSIRPEITSKSKYYISKHRYYELKHFCLQYCEWKEYIDYLYSKLAPETVSFESIKSITNISDSSVESLAIAFVDCQSKIDMIENVAKETDKELWNYILKAVTEGVSYTKFDMVDNIPCGKEKFYDRYRKFFWLLSKRRN